jgi:hypothetical protein
MTGTKLVQFSVPSGMKFVTVLNATNNEVQLYQDLITIDQVNLKYSLLQNSLYYNQTLPLRDGNNFTLVWFDGGGSEQKKLTLMFTVESLQINNPTSQPGTTSNTAIISDSVGLAKQAQLPAALGPYGGMKTEVLNPIDVEFSPTAEFKVNNTTSEPVPIKDMTVHTLDCITSAAVTVTATVRTVSGLGIILSAPDSNTAPILYGGPTIQSLNLLPGQTVILPVASVYVKVATGTQALGVGALQ